MIFKQSTTSTKAKGRVARKMLTGTLMATLVAGIGIQALQAHADGNGTADEGGITVTTENIGADGALLGATSYVSLDSSGAGISFDYATDQSESNIAHNVDPVDSRRAVNQAVAAFRTDTGWDLNNAGDWNAFLIEAAAAKNAWSNPATEDPRFVPSAQLASEALAVINGGTCRDRCLSHGAIRFAAISAILGLLSWQIDHIGALSDNAKLYIGGFVTYLGIAAGIVSLVLGAYDQLGPGARAAIDAVSLHTAVNNAMSAMAQATAQMNQAFGGDANNGGPVQAALHQMAAAALPAGAPAGDIEMADLHA